MSIFHIFLAVLVAATWGINFTFVKLGLNELPPLFLCGLRFLLIGIPFAFILKKPKVPSTMLLKYSMFTFTIQFGLLFLALQLGMPAGASSLVFQIQIFISLFIAAIVFKEWPSKVQVLGGLIACIGIGFVWLDIQQPTTLIGLVIEIIAATSWAIGNTYSKKMGQTNSLALVVWGGLLSTIPIFTFSFIFEGPELIIQSLQHATWISVMSVTYTTYVATAIGYGLWNKLLNTYPFPSIIPFTLLIPVFGMLSSMLVFNEKLTQNKLIAAILIIMGLSINIFGNKALQKITKKKVAPELNPT